MGVWDQWDELLAQQQPDALEVLTLAAQYERYLDAIMSRAVPSARSAGYTWEQIGQAIGTSRQAVWQKYRPLLKSVPATLQPSPMPAWCWEPARLVPDDPDTFVSGDD